MLIKKLESFMQKKRYAIIITGATKRLGLAFTQKSLSMGFSVIAHYRTTAFPLKEWLSTHTHFKDRVQFIQADLDSDQNSFIKKCATLNPFLIGLVNNASVFTKGNLDNQTHFCKTHHINVSVPYLLSLHFSEIIKTGWIINITDVNISHNVTYQNYRISKRMLTETTLQQALSMAPKIRVNAIAPGAILPSNQTDDNYFNDLKEKAPLKRNGDLESIQQAFSFLVENKCVTGQIIYVDSGVHLL